MGWDRKNLPDHIKTKIDDPVIRKQFGPTFAEQVAKKDEQSEDQLRDQLLSFCRRHELLVISPNPKKKSTIQVGAADLTICWRNRVLFMELKVGNNTLSEEQREFAKKVRTAHCAYFVVREYAIGIQILKTFFKLKINPQNEQPRHH